MSKQGDQFSFVLGGIFAILILLRSIPEFEAQYFNITACNRPAINNWVLWWVSSHREVIMLEDQEYQAVVAKLQTSLNGQRAPALNPDSCILALADLSWQWQLKICKPFIGTLLFITLVAEELMSLGLPISKGSAFHAHYAVADTNTLHLQIPYWLLIEERQEAIMKNINTQLTEYRGKLRAAGISDYPPTLKLHAQWWFQHYVQHQKYPMIANQDHPNSETVKRAVWQFRKLLHIEL
jgi:hypothetical protein